MAVKNKIELHTYRSKDDSKLAGVVKLTPQAETKLLELAAETGLSIRTIASELILQAAEMVEIVEG